MVHPSQTHIVDVPLNRIRVLNSRTRSRRRHKDIVESIASVGLKRPITVSPRVDAQGETSYDLVCGEGRIEAVRMLGHETIPARIVERDECGCLEMGLVENVARRNHTAVALLRDVQSMIKSGQSVEAVAAKVGLSVSYMQSILTLLEQGEERLVATVEAGTLPIGLAISISRSENTELQRALADAYAEGTLKARQLAVVRRIIDQRLKHKKLQTSGGRVAGRPALSSEALRKMYVRESEHQQLLSKKADFVHAQLTLLVSSLRHLLRDPEFTELLRTEGLENVPKVLWERINREASDERR